jgi:hypothetical protein
MIAQVVGNSLFSGSTTASTTLSGAGDTLLSVMTDPPVGAVVQAIN